MPELQVVPASKRTPLERQVGWYIEDREAANLSSRSIANDIKPRLERIFLPWCSANGITEPSQIDQQAINRFSNHLRTHGGAKGQLSIQTVASYVKTVNAFLNWLRSQGQEATGVGRKPKLPERELEVLSKQEVDAMLKLATTRDRLIVQLLYDSGIRASELVGLRVRDLVQDDVPQRDGGRQHQWQIRIIRKGNREQRIPIEHKTWLALRNYARSRDAGESDALFMGHRRGRDGAYHPLTVSGLEQMLRFLGRNAGVQRKVYPHLFRHTFITRLVERGVDSVIIRRYVGHSSTALIDKAYAHVRPHDMANIVLEALHDEP